MGQWRDDKMHGKGVYYYHGGRKYIGEWIDGQRNDIGVLELENGDRYENHYSMTSQSGMYSLMKMLTHSNVMK